jgi:hypothetical protein
LSKLKDEILSDPLPGPVLYNKVKVLSVSSEYETDLITLFHASGDFNNRGRWQAGVKKVEEVNHFLPRVGMRCRCILDNGEIITYSSSYSYTDDKIEFGEIEEGSGSVAYFTLEKLARMKSRLTIDYYIEKKFLKQIEFKLIGKKKLLKMYQQSLLNLVELVKEIQLPVD